MCDANSWRTGVRVERLRMGLSVTHSRSALRSSPLKQARTSALFERDLRSRGSYVVGPQGHCELDERTGFVRSPMIRPRGEKHAQRPPCNFQNTPTRRGSLRAELTCATTDPI